MTKHDKIDKKDKTEKKGKKGRGKTALKIILIILAVIVVLILVAAVVNKIGNSANTDKAKSFDAVDYPAQLEPEKDKYGNWTFTCDRDFKVVQLTDIHLGAGFMSFKKDAMALNAVAAMVTAEKPDLVIVTGDISYPVPFQAGTFNNKTSAKMLAELMDELGVYWTLCYGNHDTEAYSFYSREDLSALYSSDKYKYCLFQAGPEDVSGSGNQIINIKNSKGVITQSLYLLDSHSYTDGDIFGAMWKYDNIHADQIEWYKENVLKYNKLNAAACKEAGVKGDTEVKSAMFMHIPLTEYRDAWYEYADNGFKDTLNVQLVYGTAGESNKVVYCGINDDDMFETIQKLGSTQGVFCGHDHKNNFSLLYKGIRLTYGMSVDYLAYVGIYKLGSQRGCTVISFSPNGGFNCSNQNYYQSKYTSVYDKEPVTMQEQTTVAITEEE